MCRNGFRLPRCGMVWKRPCRPKPVICLPLLPFLVGPSCQFAPLPAADSGGEPAVSAECVRQKLPRSSLSRKRLFEWLILLSGLGQRLFAGGVAVLAQLPRQRSHANPQGLGRLGAVAGKALQGGLDHLPFHLLQA